MYGDDPFGEGLGHLAEAAHDAAEAAGAASPAIPLAYAVPVEMNEGGAAAAPTAAQGGDRGNDAAPEEVSAKQLKHRAAARAIVPGCQHWDVKNRGTWPAAATIPNADAMRWDNKL